MICSRRAALVLCRGKLALFAPGAFGKPAGFLRAAQQTVGTDVAIELRPIDRCVADLKIRALAPRGEL
jgi:hypothetical protein